jgi:hypothetical protein
MTMFEDYNEWYKDNRGLIEKIYEEGYVLLLRIQDVFKVMQYIDEENTLNKGAEEELIDIFEVGFGYLFEQISQLKIYFEDYFNLDMKLMEKYASLINYSLYIDDFRETIIDKDEYTKEIQETFDVVQDRIDQILSDKTAVKKDFFEEFDLMINSVFSNPKHYQTVAEIFGLIAEELNL